VLPTFIIGLREGLEASLIVGIVAAFLVAERRRDALGWMAAGVAAAVALCFGVAVVLQLLSRDLPERAQEILESAIALVAVLAVTWMILWMRGHARTLKRTLEEGVRGALAAGSVRALVAMAFLAVLREGFETSVFLLALFQHAESPAAARLGAALGIALAVAIGYGIYRGGVRIDLARFFRVTGIVLVFVAAGLCAAAVHSAHEAGLITILQSRAIDLSWLIRPGTPLAALITGMLGLQPEPTRAEALAYLLYLVPMLAFVLWPGRRAVPAPPVRPVGVKARS
jgi:high-affinity iron transporter